MAFDWSVPAQPDEFDNLLTFETFGAGPTLGTDHPDVQMDWVDYHSDMPSNVPGLEEWGSLQNEQQSLLDSSRVETYTDPFCHNDPIHDQSFSEFYPHILNGLESSVGLSSFEAITGVLTDYRETSNLTPIKELVNTIPTEKPQQSNIPKRGRSQEDDYDTSNIGNRPKHRRVTIPAAAKAVLEHHFLSDPYPDDASVVRLSNSTELDTRNIKNWFSNARSRKTVLKGKFSMSL